MNVSDYVQVPIAALNMSAMIIDTLCLMLRLPLDEQRIAKVTEQLEQAAETLRQMAELKPPANVVLVDSESLEEVERWAQAEVIRHPLSDEAENASREAFKKTLSGEIEVPTDDDSRSDRD